METPVRSGNKSEVTLDFMFVQHRPGILGDYNTLVPATTYDTEHADRIACAIARYVRS
jgi:hypothetical protein